MVRSFIVEQLLDPRHVMAVGTGGSGEGFEGGGTTWHAFSLRNYRYADIMFSIMKPFTSLRTPASL